ncbi:Uncharacterised protein g7061 [Pycnogonum litorale]
MFKIVKKISSTATIRLCRNITSRTVFPLETQKVLDELNAMDENRRNRVELAAAHRGLDMCDLSEGVCNHLTTLAPAKDHPNTTVMLAASYGLHWSEVTASNIIGLNDENEVVEGQGEPQNSAICIHRGLYKSRPDITTVLHTHMPYITALAMAEGRSFRFLHQNSSKFYNDIAYDLELETFAESEEEGLRLGEKLGDKRILIMGNHGVVVATKSIAKAFDMLFYLERFAKIQVLAESTGRKLINLSPKALEELSSYDDHYWEKFEVAHFSSVIRRLKKNQPDFQE